MIKARTLKTPRQKMEDRLDGLYRELVRKLAMKKEHGCQFCHKPKWSYLGLETAHCFGRGHHTVRWDVRNGAVYAPTHIATGISMPTRKPKRSYSGGYSAMMNMRGWLC